MNKYKTLGDLLIAHRAYHNLSQSDFASSIDVDVRSVIRWEKNETLLSGDTEKLLTKETFIPYQVIRNLNANLPIATFYDFDLRKYSLSKISSDLPDANWIKSRLNYGTERITTISSDEDLNDIIRFIELQRNPQKSIDKNLILAAARMLPELNLIISDQSGYYSGHCIYFPISNAAYQRIKNRDMLENELQASDLVNYKTQEQPVFYCHSITSDCNENFFYIIGEVLKFYRDLQSDNYIYSLLTSRHDSRLMSVQLGVKTIWEDFETQKKYNLLDTPRLVEGNFNAFFNRK